MSSVQNPTYFLAPNWTFRPGGPIALGNIIADPFRPHKPLSKPDPSTSGLLPPTETVVEKNWVLSASTTRSVSLAVWTQFLDIVSVKLGASSERVKNGHFTMHTVETVYFTEEPSAAYISARCSDGVISKLMKPGSPLRRPVYMVTGIKIAKGFALQGEKSSSSGFTAEAGAPVAAGASVGGSAELSSKKSTTEGFESTGDIVFAYQLMKIAPKGWGKKTTLKTEDFQHRAAFLGDLEEQTEGTEKVDIESGSVVADSIDPAEWSWTAKEVEVEENDRGPGLKSISIDVARQRIDDGRERQRVQRILLVRHWVPDQIIDPVAELCNRSNMQLSKTSYLSLRFLRPAIVKSRKWLEKTKCSEDVKTLEESLETKD